MAESIENFMANGGGFAPTATPATLGGFSAASLWDGVYDFAPFKDEEGNSPAGEIPPPTQERIDTFRRAMSEFAIEAQRLAHEAEKAEAKRRAKQRKAAEEAAAKGEEYIEPFSVQQAKKEIDTALKEERRLYDAMRDEVASFCQGSPTRKDLDVLPDSKFNDFVNHLAGLINPTT